jgi:hypothetical protein
VDAPFFWLVVFGIIAWIVVTIRGKRARARDEAAQTAVERRCLDLMVQFPKASDEEIAQLIRDDLVNRRVRYVELFKWASAETVGRVRCHRR